MADILTSGVHIGFQKINWLMIVRESEWPYMIYGLWLGTTSHEYTHTSNDLLKWDCRIKDHLYIQMGYKTWLWCLQDSTRNQKSRNSTVPGIKNQDTVGMQWYDCNSSLIVACWKADTLNGTDHVISVQLQHHEQTFHAVLSHVHYYTYPHTI